MFFPYLCCNCRRSTPFSGTPEIEHSLHKLNELGTILMIAAHPDDERTAVLAYFARGRHMRTAYLSLTRGEGGQNLIGSEQGAQLGFIRTQELLAARQIDGAEQFFTRAIDFGFTRTAAETMQKWGHDRILSDVVWVIRRYRPDVIDCGFSAGRRAMDTGSTRRRPFWARRRSTRRPTQAVSGTVEVRAAVAGEAAGAGRGFSGFGVIDAGLPGAVRRCGRVKPAQRGIGGYRRIQPHPGLFL